MFHTMIIGSFVDAEFWDENPESVVFASLVTLDLDILFSGPCFVVSFTSGVNVLSSGQANDSESFT